MDARRSLPTREPSEDEWLSGLTAMREFQLSVTDARVLLRGQVANYKGRMPGVAETLGLVEPWTGSRNGWSGRRNLEAWTARDLNNGLSPEENEVLAGTPFIGQAVLLVLCGVHRLGRQGQQRTR